MDTVPQAISTHRVILATVTTKFDGLPSLFVSGKSSGSMIGSSASYASLASAATVGTTSL
jgi:hypothetical protein